MKRENDEVDLSDGQGHLWRNVIDLSPDIAEEIAAEILDGKIEECDDFVASDGRHYRWAPKMEQKKNATYDEIKDRLDAEAPWTYEGKCGACGEEFSMMDFCRRPARKDQCPKCGAVAVEMMPTTHFGVFS